MVELITARLSSSSDPISRRSAYLGDKGPPKTLSTCVMTIVAAFILIPADFVTPWSPIPSILYATTAMALIGVSCYLIAQIDRTWAVLSCVILLVGALPFLTAGTSNPLSGLYVALPIVFGMIVSSRLSPNLAYAFLTISTLTLVSETLLARHWYSEIFGQPRFVSYADGVFRARGLIGQPVPAAFVSTTLAFALLIYCLYNRRRLLAITVVIAWIASLIVTGTRSALLVSAVLLIPILYMTVRRIRPNAAYLVAVMGALIAGSVAILAASSATWSVRLFEFSSISSSESGIVRGRAVDSLRSFPNDCPVTCAVFGHGGRNLQTQLTNNPVQFGLSTVDNQYVSLYWDFGVVGVLAFVALSTFGAVALFRGKELSSVIGGAIIVSLAFAALFFDALYVRPVAILFGVGLGLCIMQNQYIDAVEEG